MDPIEQSHKVLFRPLTMDRFQQVLALWKACDGIGLSKSDTPEKIAQYLERNPRLSTLAIVQEQVVGAVLCGHDGRRGFLHHLAVHPAFRHQQIGTRLIERCLEALHTQGIEKCHLFVIGENEQGIAFWRNRGWTQRVELVIMSKWIAKP